LLIARKALIINPVRAKKGSKTAGFKETAGAKTCSKVGQTAAGAKQSGKVKFTGLLCTSQQ